MPDAGASVTSLHTTCRHDRPQPAESGRREGVSGANGPSVPPTPVPHDPTGTVDLRPKAGGASESTRTRRAPNTWISAFAGMMNFLGACI